MTVYYTALLKAWQLSRSSCFSFLPQPLLTAILGRTNLWSRKLSFPAWKSSYSQGEILSLGSLSRQKQNLQAFKASPSESMERKKIKPTRQPIFFSKDFKTNFGFKWSVTSSVIPWPLPGRDVSRATPPLVSSAIHCRSAFPAGTIICGRMLSLLLPSCALFSPS